MRALRHTIDGLFLRMDDWRRRRRALAELARLSYRERKDTGFPSLPGMMRREEGGFRQE